MASPQDQVRRALELELPTVTFYDEEIEYLANAWHEGADVPDAWAPMFIGRNIACDDERAREVCRAVLERLRSTGDASAAATAAAAQGSPPSPAASSSSPAPDGGHSTAVAEAAAAAKAAGLPTFGPEDAPYILLDKLGSGACGTVYRCMRAGDSSQEFAAKVIPLVRLRTQRDPKEAMERLQREKEILRALNHPHVTALYDVWETSDTLYLVMELVEGGELFDDIVKNGCLTEDEARHVFLQLADALTYIHSQNVVHRDLKPENILVNRKASTQGMLEVKITDFGYAKLLAHDTAALTQVGTPQYWAPEISDPRTCAKGYTKMVDLWSLGVVLYVMLEGSYPFEGAGPWMEEQVRAGRFDFRPDSATSSEGKDLIRKLIQVKPSARLPLADCLKHPWVHRGKPPGSA